MIVTCIEKEKIMTSSYLALKLIRSQRQKYLKNVVEILKVESRYSQVDIQKPLFYSEKNTCRICLKEGRLPIFDNEMYKGIVESIQIFGDIQLAKDDDFPKYLCEVCHSRLEGAILFRKLAKESDKILHHKFNESLDTEVVAESGEEPKHKTFKCKLCQISFHSNEEYTSHKNCKQHKKVRIQCSICHRLLTTHMFTRHLKRHESTSQLICEVCGKMFRKDNLIRHLQLHSFDLPYKCQLCPYRGRYVDALKIHMRTHTGDKPYSCDKCELRFLTRSNLNRHLLTHKKERPFKCDECDKAFYTKREFDLHFKSNHIGIKEYGCLICGNKFGTKKTLRRHELAVHKREKMAQGRRPLYLQKEYKEHIE